MRFSLMVLLSLIQQITCPAYAEPPKSENATTIQRSGNVYAFYAIIGKKDSVLLQKDSLEETYYGDRKIPDSIQTSVNPYNQNELAVYWTEHNTLSEGETGSDGTVKRYVAVIDVLLKKEVFRYEYFHSRNGWTAEMSGKDQELKTGSYEEIIRNNEIVFSEQKIMVRNLKNSKALIFLYNPYMRKYVEK